MKVWENIDRKFIQVKLNGRLKKAEELGWRNPKVRTSVTPMYICKILLIAQLRKWKYRQAMCPLAKEHTLKWNTGSVTPKPMLLATYRLLPQEACHRQPRIFRRQWVSACGKGSRLKRLPKEDGCTEMNRISCMLKKRGGKILWRCFNKGNGDLERIRGWVWCSRKHLARSQSLDVAEWQREAFLWT